MKNTNPIFSLKNFRSFGEEGADFELAPITVLTGCNSAGKSSLVKALILLSKEPFAEGMDLVSYYYLYESHDDIVSDNGLRNQAGSHVVKNYPRETIKVSTKELGFGNYHSVLNQNSSDGTIVMSYKIWSYYLQEELIVKRCFKEGVIKDEGKLTSFSIERRDGRLLYRLNVSNENETEEGWNIYDIELKCNDYINYCKFIRFQDIWQHSSNPKCFFRQPDGSEVESFKRQREKRTNEASQYMEEIRGRLCNRNCIEEYQLTQDWEETISPCKIFEVVNENDIEEVKSLCNPEENEEQRRLQNDVFHSIVNECVFPWFIKDIKYVDSLSSPVKRIYPIVDNDKMYATLSKFDGNGKAYVSLSNYVSPSTYSEYYSTGEFVNYWLEKFGIASKIEIETLEDNGGIKVYLVWENEGRRLLADEGYGLTQLISLFIQIDIVIKENEMYSNRFQRITKIHRFVAIEEPEIHLHPKYQSLLADMFVEAYQKYNIHFIIETHSEYLIRKLQVLVADKENKLTPNDVSLNYVDKDENGISTNRKIEIREDGCLSAPFGTGFFDESKNLVMKMMKF